MRKYALWIIAGCFYCSGFVQLARWWTRRSRGKLVILNYHCAAGGNLRNHLRYLHRHYRVMHLESALEELSSPKKPERGDNRIPLVLTFDDGYRDNYTHGFPLARQLQVPLTIFLVPGYIDSGARFWWREAEHLVSCAQVDEAVFEGRCYRLSQVEQRQALAVAIDARLRSAPTVDEREKFLEAVRELLRVSPAAVPGEEPTLPLTWEEVREMEKSGWVSFGAHTMHHPILAQLTDPAEVRYEVEKCRAVLEAQLGHPVRSFAYPVGQLQHIGEDVVRAVQQAGYCWALTTRYGLNTSRSDPFLLRRIEADVDQHWLVIAAEAAGLWGFFSRLRWVPAIRGRLTAPFRKG